MNANKKKWASLHITSADDGLVDMVVVVVFVFMIHTNITCVEQ